MIPVHSNTFDRKHIRNSSENFGTVKHSRSHAHSKSKWESWVKPILNASTQNASGNLDTIKHILTQAHSRFKWESWSSQTHLNASTFKIQVGIYWYRQNMLSAHTFRFKYDPSTLKHIWSQAHSEFKWEFWHSQTQPIARAFKIQVGILGQTHLERKHTQNATLCKWES